MSGVALRIDEPEALTSLTATCDAYEVALGENDLEALDRLFWDDPRTVRYGVGENLYGIEAIRAFRRERPGGSPPRDVLRREIVVFDGRFGVCELEFRRLGGSRIGRQSQTWILTEAGWRIAAAHVSLMADGS